MAPDGDGAIYEDRTVKLGPAIMSVTFVVCEAVYSFSTGSKHNRTV